MNWVIGTIVIICMGMLRLEKNAARLIMDTHESLLFGLYPQIKNLLNLKPYHMY